MPEAVKNGKCLNALTHLYLYVTRYSHLSKEFSGTTMMILIISSLL